MLATAFSAVVMVPAVKLIAVLTAPTSPYTVPARIGFTPANSSAATVPLATPSARLFSAFAVAPTIVALMRNGRGTKPPTMALLIC